eukprot:Pgem_evm1s19380
MFAHEEVHTPTHLTGNYLPLRLRAICHELKVVTLTPQEAQVNVPCDESGYAR